VHVVLLNQYYAPSEAATAQLLADVGAYLAREGHRVSVVCSRRSYPDPSLVYPSQEAIDGVSVFRTWTTGFGRGSRLGRMLDYLVFMLGATRVLVLLRDIDVVVSLTTPPLLTTVGMAAARLRGARAVQWVMDIYPELAFELDVLRRGSPAGRVLSGLADFTLRRADAVIALGETMARKLHAAGAPNLSVVRTRRVRSRYVASGDGRTTSSCCTQATWGSLTISTPHSTRPRCCATRSACSSPSSARGLAASTWRARSPAVAWTTSSFGRTSRGTGSVRASPLETCTW
jgi:hypothetical protein